MLVQGSNICQFLVFMISVQAYQSSLLQFQTSQQIIREIDAEITKYELLQEFYQRDVTKNNSFDYNSRSNYRDSQKLPSYQGALKTDFSHDCIIPKSPSLTSIKPHLLYSFQSHKQSYTGFSSQSNGSTKFIIVNSECEIISQISHKIQDVLTDRNTVSQGTLFLFTQSQEILSCQQTQNFTDCFVLSRIYDNTSEYVGGMVRSKGKGNPQIFIIFQNQPIMYNLLICQSHQQQWEYKIKIKVIGVIDHHPSPILVTKTNWVHFLDTVHYTTVISNCQYPNIEVESIISTNSYSSYFYLTSKSGIIKYEMKSQNKQCQVSHRFYHPDLRSIDFSKKGSDFLGSLFIGNQIINFTSHNIAQIIECNQNSGYQFKGWRNSQKSGFITFLCCINHDTQCNLSLLKVSQNYSYSKKTTVLLTVSLLLFIWGVFYFFRSVEPKLSHDEIIERQNKNPYMFTQQVDSYIQNKKKQNQTSQKDDQTPKKDQQVR